MSRRMLAVGLILAVLCIDRTPYAAESSFADPATITIYPVTTGLSYHPSPPMARVLVLGTHASAPMATVVSAAKEVFQRGGMTIIDKTPPQSLVPRQGPLSNDRAAVDDALLAFGKDAGADHLILLDFSDTLILDESGQSLGGYLHDERITVRGIGVADGTLVLEGTARWSQPVDRSGHYLRQLTAYAIGRALCPPNKWEEASDANNGRGKCRR